MFYQISDPEVFNSWDGGQGLEDLGVKDSQRGVPPNRGKPQATGGEVWHSVEDRQAPFRGVGLVG